MHKGDRYLTNLVSADIEHLEPLEGLAAELSDIS